MKAEMLTVEQLVELEALEKAATSGPWHREMLELTRGGPMTLGIGAAERAVCIVNGIVESPVGNRDVALITVTRNALPALLAMAKRLLELKAALEFLCDKHDALLVYTSPDGDQSMHCTEAQAVLNQAEYLGWQSPTAKGPDDV